MRSARDVVTTGGGSRTAARHRSDICAAAALAPSDQTRQSALVVLVGRAIRLTRRSTAGLVRQSVSMVAPLDDVKRRLERVLDEPVQFAVPASEARPTLVFWQMAAVFLVAQVAGRILMDRLGAIVAVATLLVFGAAFWAIMRRLGRYPSVLPRSVIIGVVGNRVVVASAGHLRVSRAKRVLERHFLDDVRFAPNRRVGWDRVQLGGRTWFTNPSYRREILRFVSSAGDTT